MNEVVFIKHLDNSSNIYLPSNWNSIEDYKNKIKEKLKTFVIENELLIFLFTQDIMNDEKLQFQTLNVIKSIAKKTGPKYDIPVIIIKIKDSDGNKIKGDLPNKLQQLNKIAKITKWDQFITNPQIIIDDAVQKWQGHIEKQTTHVKDEHYVAQSYLKNFSKDQIHIWEYDLDKRFAEHYPEIETVCNKRYLYEFRNKQNDIIAKNALENRLKICDDLLLEVLQAISAKSFIKNNENSECFLTKEERVKLGVIVCEQLFRHPKTMEAATSTFHDTFGKDEQLANLTDTEIKNLVLSICLPLLNETAQFEQIAWAPILTQILSSSFFIISSFNDVFLTCDNPVFPIKESEKDTSFREIIMPLTPRLILVIKKEKTQRNKLIFASNDNIVYYNCQIAQWANEYIYSKNKIKNKQKDMLLKQRGNYFRELKKLKENKNR